MSEGFGSIKDIIIQKKNSFFSNLYKNEREDIAKFSSEAQIISLSPKYLIDLVAFTLVIVLIIYASLSTGNKKSNHNLAL